MDWRSVIHLAANAIHFESMDVVAKLALQCKDVFRPGLWIFKDAVVHIPVPTEAKPIFFKARPRP